MAAYGYKQKGQITLAWMDNRERVTLEGRQMLRRVLDTALAELDKQFAAGIRTDTILHLGADKNELRELLLKVAQKQLAPPESEESQ